MNIITIGRSTQCNIVVSGEGVSRDHADMYIADGKYVFSDHSSNGTIIKGMLVHNNKVIVVPGTTILLGNSTPLPWDKVYQLLPLEQGAGSEAQTVIQLHQQPMPQPPRPQPQCQSAPQPARDPDDEMGCGCWAIAILFPIVGFILYFVWKEDHPHRAKQIGLVSLIVFIISFILGMISGIVSTMSSLYGY